MEQFIAILTCLCLATLAHVWTKLRAANTDPLGPVPVSVNYHFTRRCNKECGFCFHTAKTSHVATLEEAKRGLSMLKTAGMKKLNFAGGEPFLYPKYLGNLVIFSKQVLKLESVSIVSNGSKISKSWFGKYGKHLDILAISCDSFYEATNIKIGRGDGNNVTQLFQIRDWCEEFGIKFKLNTVVCRYNWDEDMAGQVAALRPFRWKCFQVLRVEGENDGSDRTLRDARKFEIEDGEFESFCQRHRHLKCFVPESNKLMAESYLVLDEYLRFLSGTNKNLASESILGIGVQAALQEIRWDQESFRARGGVYEWTKDELGGASGGGCDSELAKTLAW